MPELRTKRTMYTYDGTAEARDRVLASVEETVAAMRADGFRNVEADVFFNKTDAEVEFTGEFG